MRLLPEHRLLDFILYNDCLFAVPLDDYASFNNSSLKRQSAMKIR